MSTLMYKICKLGDGIVFVKSFVDVGRGNGPLTHDGLRKRFLQLLFEKGESNILHTNDGYSIESLIEEERQLINDIKDNKVTEFLIDTTMTAMCRSSTDGIILHSPIEFDETLYDDICTALNVPKCPVTTIIAPNLQHWLYITSWVNRFPEANIYVAPPDINGDDGSIRESLSHKLAPLMKKKLNVINVMSQDEGFHSILHNDFLQYHILEGASYMLNEVAFFHVPSKVLILADAFYSGYDPKKKPFPNAFSRIWFKLTKNHWHEVSLPIYRTNRIIKEGNSEKFLECLTYLIDKWEPVSIVSAHGNRVPFNLKKGDNSLIRCWIDGLKC